MLEQQPSSWVGKFCQTPLIFTTTITFSRIFEVLHMSYFGILKQICLETAYLVYDHPIIWGSLGAYYVFCTLVLFDISSLFVDFCGIFAGN